MTTTTRRHTLTLEHQLARPSATRPGELDFNESTSLFNERDVLVLYVYRTTGLGWAYHVLVGRAQYAVGSYATHDAAKLDGFAALRRVPGYADAAVVSTTDQS